MSLLGRKPTKVDNSDKPHLFGWCIQGFGGGKVSHDRCPKSFTTHQPSALPQGTIVNCQCECHGKDTPRYANLEQAPRGLADVALLDEDDDEAGNPSDSTSRAPVAPPVGSGELSEVDAARAETEAKIKRALGGDDGLERTETKRFPYPTGEVARTERASVTKQGKDVILIEWLAYNKVGTRIGAPQWSRKAAKELLP